MEKQRNIVFDAIKALAIVLVVYAHSIQYLSGYEFWNNTVFQFIYSFHMPLFFMISGFFMSSALKLSGKDFLTKKGISLLLPCFVWTIIFSCLDFQGWHKMLTAVINPMHWKLWFLKGLFLVQLIIYMCMKMAAKIANRGGAKATNHIRPITQPSHLHSSFHVNTKDYGSYDLGWVLYPFKIRLVRQELLLGCFGVGSGIWGFISILECRCARVVCWRESEDIRSNFRGSELDGFDEDDI